MVDAEYAVQYINPAYTRITGITAEDIVGKPLKDICPRRTSFGSSQFR